VKENPTPEAGRQGDPEARRDQLNFDACELWLAALLEKSLGACPEELAIPGTMRSKSRA